MFHTKNILNRMMHLSLLASVGFAALLSLAQTDAALAATAPSLGAADSFAVLGHSTVTNTGPTLVTGDLGLYPGTSITGFPPGIVTGTQHATDAVALQAQSDATTAYNNLLSQACNATISADLGGMTLIPGVYCSGSSMGLTGTLTLDAQGDPNAVWIFKMPESTLTTAGSSVVFINGGQDCNVFWQVGSSATLGTTSKVVGTIIADASITLNTGATVSGRVLALNAAVTLDSNIVSVCSLSQPPPPPTPTPPTLGKGFSSATIDLGETSTLTITLSNPNLSVATLSAAFTDTLPAGLTIATTPNASTTCGGVVTAPAGGNTVTLTGGSIPGGAPGTCRVRVDVTSATAGFYLNTLVIGALQTSNGSNAAPAIATLTVNPLVPPVPPVPPIAPTLGKGFSPVSINAGGVSTLTITLSNPNVSIATLTAPFIDILPTGVVIAATPNASTTCGGGATVTATAGGNTVTLPTGRSIPASSGGIAGTCTVTVDVTAPFGGSFLNTLAVGVLQTSNGSNAAPAIATLTVVPLIIIPPTAIPTLNEWGMIIFMVLVGLMSIYYLRRQKAKA